MKTSFVRIPLFCLTAMAGLVTLDWLGRPAVSGAADVAATTAVKWEYVTGAVEPGALQARLTELGKDGWDVFSIERIDSTVDQTADGKTHLVSEKLEVSAKRPAKPQP